MKRAHDLDPFLRRLRELPFVRGAQVVEEQPITRGSAAQPLHRADTVVFVETPGENHRCFVEHKATNLTREVAAQLVQLGQVVPKLLVLAPHVGRDLSTLFVGNGINFIDLAGNCHVRFGNRYLALIQGNPRVGVATSAKGMRAAAYAVLLAFLIAPELIDGTTRAIGAAAGVSPQTAADLRARLVERGLILRVKSRLRWSLLGQKKALDLWLAGWSTTFFPHLLIGRFRAREQDVSVLEQRLAAALSGTTSWRWGGGAAALRLTHYYRGEQTVLYVDQPPADLARRLGLVPDREGPVVLMRMPGPLALRSPNPETTHPLLVYTDLLTEGHDRAREAAGEVYSAFLAPAEEIP